MQISEFIKIIKSDFYVGVPDSQLKALCDYLMSNYGIDGKHHLIAANEGNAVGIAAGYNIATNKIPVVYLQNSGLGNIINPVASLLNEKIYGIPMIFVVGWRGEPGVHDEPQHLFQGEITLKLLEDIDIEYYIIDKNTNTNDIINVMNRFNNLLENNKQVAFIIKKGALEYDQSIDYSNENVLIREDAINKIVEYTHDDLIVSTTGKISRELYEIREKQNPKHDFDFLTVGSMGHCSSIALGIALNTNKRVWCLDGDGAVLMHMGAMSTIGSMLPDNYVHIVLNNEAHESVGGMPTTIKNVNLCDVAKSCGYEYTASVNNINDLDKQLKHISENKVLSFLEIKVSIYSRKDLGRPKTSPVENLDKFKEII